jgi:uncharacterized protein
MQENIKNNHTLLIGTLASGVILIFSLIFLISAKSFSDQGSYIEVKGSSEKIVKADVAIWNLSFNINSNDIDDLYSAIEEKTVIINKFLKDKGFTDAEINMAPVSIYQNSYKDALFLYNSTTRLSVYTNKVDLVKSSSKETLNLIKRGVALNMNDIDFAFSDINSVKPTMLAESIKNAKDTAKGFAKESNSSLGSVVRGNQGVFDISEKDPGSPEYKKIRVVSTLRFLLK